MEKESQLHEQPQKKHGSKLPSILSALLITLTVTSCGWDRLRNIDGKIMDTESEILTRGDNQRRINREWNTYISHFWHWDEAELSKLEKWTYKRSKKNRKHYNRLIDRFNRLTKKRDNIRANARGHINYQYDEHEFENSDQAIQEAMEIEFE